VKLLDVLTSPWAIIPSKLEEITQIYATHLRGDKIDLAAVEARLGRPLNNERKGYQIVDGVAVVEAAGPLAKRANLFMQISGGTSMQILGQELRQALADSAVSAVVLALDSPGGTVDGTEELARIVMEARAGDKPVVAWVDGLMASAAYWIGASADAVFIGASTDTVGSIGVAMQHIDTSASDAKAGIKRTDIYAGKYKRIASDTGPLSKDGKAYLQNMVDALYAAFVEHVAQARGVALDTVLADMADGRLFIGQQAIDAGLADGMTTLDALVADLAAGRYQVRRSAGARSVITNTSVAPGDARPATAPGGRAAPQTPNAAAAAGAGGAPDVAAAPGSPQAPIPSQPLAPAGVAGAPDQRTDMDLATLRAQHPELAQALLAEGAANERQRIADVRAAALPGHEALIERLAADGQTTGAQAAAAVIAAERASLAAAGVALRQERPAPVEHGASASGDAAAEAAAESQAADAAAPIEERARANWDKSAELRNEFPSYDAYAAWFKANEAGRVKVLGAAKARA